MHTFTIKQEQKEQMARKLFELTPEQACFMTKEEIIAYYKEMGLINPVDNLSNK